ncbi:hypothetical protein LMG28688_01638 [Paraburkholderia caffeinitolerans]|uniref:Uncharacterized protein n=1 Tax=Paraburkholderia caffeinitolerans TaxID=1723730 RepID=A0A6J5FSJ6_9BURK|nr:hypothetical protein LMG28688_01638 [Paraburkholderia caffeinitolerans]
MLAFLAQEGVDADLPVTCLSDDSDTVRRARLNFGDCGARGLDWFHVAMRVQNLEPVIKGLLERDLRLPNGMKRLPGVRPE